MTSCKPIQLAYKLFETTNDSSKKNPVIFLHGAGSTKESWLDIPQKVAEATRRRVYAVDMRNHGDSEWSDMCDYDDNTQDLINFIEKLNIRKCIIIGHSFGGCICMKAALRMPSKIEKLVVEDMGITLPSADFRDFIESLFLLIHEAVQHIPAHFSIEDGNKFVRDFVYKSLPEAVKSSVKVEELVPNYFLKKNTDGNFKLKTNFKELARFVRNEAVSTWQWKGIYNGPSFFICGGKSSIRVSQDEEEIKKMFPNAQFLILKDATHRVHNDMPGLFTDILLKFLSE